MLRIVSLFSGVGAVERGLDRLAIPYELEGFSEIDNFAVKSYCAIHNVAEGLNLGDITEVADEVLERRVGLTDLLIGGSPCQDISIVSKQWNVDKVPKGLKGAKSGLFFEYVRVLNKVKPKWFLFENVRNLNYSNKGEDYKCVIRMLSENYSVQVFNLDSKDYGIPQTRRRIFIIGQRKDLGSFNCTTPKKVKLNLKVTDLLESDVATKYYLSEKMRDYVLNNETWGSNSETDLEIARPLTSTMHKMHRASTDNYYHASTAPEGKTNLRRLTPLECFRLQGFTDDDYAKCKEVGISDKQLYQQMGNTITVPVVEALLFEMQKAFQWERKGERDENREV